MIAFFFTERITMLHAFINGFMEEVGRRGYVCLVVLSVLQLLPGFLLFILSDAWVNKDRSSTCLSFSS